MAQPNQFTKAEAEGRVPPKSSNQYLKGTRTKADPRVKAQIQATQLLNRMHKFALGKTIGGQEIKMDGNQVAAARAVIDKGLPSLQSIETKELDPMEALSLEDQIELAKSLITQHPEIIQALNLQFAPGLAPTNEGTELVTTITKPIDSTGTAG